MVRGTIFHILATGTCWLQASSLAEPIMLAAGDFVVITRGEGTRPVRPSWHAGR